MPILTKLLVIRMVANKCLGFRLNLRTFLFDLLSSFSKFSRSLGDNEKKATSEPDISAEQHNKSNKHSIVPDIAHIVNKKEESGKNASMYWEGSGSNF